MDNRKKIAQCLYELAVNSRSEFIEVAADSEIAKVAKKMNIVVPSPDIAILRTRYAKMGEANKNHVTLPPKAAKKGLPTLIGKQANWSHKGKNFICGWILDATIEDDFIVTYIAIYKSLFEEEFTKMKQMVKDNKMPVSFEIWSKSPDTMKSVMHDLGDGNFSIDPIIYHGVGILIDGESPACKEAYADKLLAVEDERLIQEAEILANDVKNENLIFASLAIDNTEESAYECKCLSCGKVVTTEQHCKDIKCPACGGEMRRKDKPGQGQPVNKSENNKGEDNKVEAEKDKKETPSPEAGTPAVQTPPTEDAAGTPTPETEQKKAEEVAGQEQPKAEGEQVETKAEAQAPAAETKPEETIPAAAETPKPETTPAETIVPKIVVKVTRQYTDEYVDTYKEGTMSGTSEGKSYAKTTTEYSDGTTDEVTTESEFKKKFDFAEVEAKVKEATDAKDAEIAALKTQHEAAIKAKDEKIEAQTKELGEKSQEIAKLTPAEEPKKEKPSMEVGNVEVAKVKTEIEEGKKQMAEYVAKRHQS